MFVNIDGDEPRIEGFEYTNIDDIAEQVCMGANTVSLRYANIEALSSIYYEDIPKMIKALQAAYDHNKSK